MYLIPPTLFHLPKPKINEKMGGLPKLAWSRDVTGKVDNIHSNQSWSRGLKAQGQGRKKISRPRPRTDPLEDNAKDQGHRRKCSPKKKRSQKFLSGDLKKKIFKNFFQAKNVFKNFFSGDLYLRKPKKRSLQIFRKVFGVFQRNFNGSKIVLSSSRGQGNFRGLEALRPKISKYVLEAEDVLEDSTSFLTLPAMIEMVAAQRTRPRTNSPAQHDKFQ